MRSALNYRLLARAGARRGSTCPSLVVDRRADQDCAVVGRVSVSAHGPCPSHATCSLKSSCLSSFGHTPAPKRFCHTALLTPTNAPLPFFPHLFARHPHPSHHRAACVPTRSNRLYSRPSTPQPFSWTRAPQGVRGGDATLCDTGTKGTITERERQHGTNTVDPYHHAFSRPTAAINLPKYSDSSALRGAQLSQISKYDRHPSPVAQDSCAIGVGRWFRSQVAVTCAVTLELPVPPSQASDGCGAPLKGTRGPFRRRRMLSVS
ncbi:hypothetical protein C8Q73DRAFT_491480 [Cubamyces lactineus]|nr:hypothetical protein C8Q73DRAFT_491480 [Cubamyces lactineus]